MQRADQAHGERDGDAKAADDDPASGIVQRRERIHHRDADACTHHRANRSRAVRFYHHSPFDLMLGKQRIQQLSVAVCLRKANVVFPVEILRCEHRLTGKPMPCGQNAHFI